TETLGVVEPFDRTETHCVNLWIHGVVRQTECGCSPRLAALARGKVARGGAPMQYEYVRSAQKSLGACHPGENARHRGGGRGQVGEDFLDADFGLVAAARGEVRDQRQAGIVEP